MDDGDSDEAGDYGSITTKAGDFGDANWWEKAATDDDQELEQKKQMEAWQKSYISAIRYGDPTPPVPGVDPAGLKALDAKLSAVCSQILPPTLSLHRMVERLKVLRAMGKGRFALTAAALKLVADENAASAKLAEDAELLPDNAAPLLAAIVAQVDPHFLPSPPGRRRISPAAGRLLALQPDQSARIGRHRLTAEAVDTFNDLIADAAAIRQLGGDPADEILAQNAFLPESDRLPEIVVEELLKRVAEAEIADLDRTVNAVRDPHKEQAVVRELCRAAHERSEAVRLGILEDADGDYEIVSRSPADMDAVRDEIKTEYLVDNMIVRGQYGTMIGPAKSGKTLCSLSIGLYGALGKPIWDSPRFTAARPFRTLLLTKESDAGLILATVDSIAEHFGVNHQALGGFECATRHPMVNHPRSLKSLKRRVEDEMFDLVIIDPLTAAVVLPANVIADQTLFYSTMRPVIDAVQEGGGTLMITHHTVKEAGKRFRKTDLHDATGAGHDGWARFWVGINRRTAYDPARGGHHELHLATGISGGRGAAIDLTIDEYADGSETRKWSAVASAPTKKARATGKRSGEDESEQDEAAQDAREEKDAACRAREAHVLAKLGEQKKPITASALQKKTKGNRKTVEKVCNRLVDMGLAEIPRASFRTVST